MSTANKQINGWDIRGARAYVAIADCRITAERITWQRFLEIRKAIHRRHQSSTQPGPAPAIRVVNNLPISSPPTPEQDGHLITAAQPGVPDRVFVLIITRNISGESGTSIRMMVSALSPESVLYEFNPNSPLNDSKAAVLWQWNIDPGGERVRGAPTESRWSLPTSPSANSPTTLRRRLPGAAPREKTSPGGWKTSGRQPANGEMKRRSP